MKERILKILLVLLGFGAASCSTSHGKGPDAGDDFGGGIAPAPEYGAPVVQFTVKGRVVDAEQNPVNGIRVTISPDAASWGNAELQSNEEGRFEGSSAFGGFNTDYVLNFQDVDGEENGGLFMDKEVSVHLTDEDMVDQSTWTKGYSKDIGDVELELKND